MTKFLIDNILSLYKNSVMLKEIFKSSQNSENRMSRYYDTFAVPLLIYIALASILLMMYMYFA